MTPLPTFSPAKSVQYAPIVGCFFERLLGHRERTIRLCGRQRISVGRRYQIDILLSKFCYRIGCPSSECLSHRMKIVLGYIQSLIVFYQVEAALEFSGLNSPAEHVRFPKWGIARARYTGHFLGVVGVISTEGVDLHFNPKASKICSVC